MSLVHHDLVARVDGHRPPRRSVVAGDEHDDGRAPAGAERTAATSHCRPPARGRRSTSGGSPNDTTSSGSPPLWKLSDAAPVRQVDDVVDVPPRLAFGTDAIAPAASAAAAGPLRAPVDEVLCCEDTPVSILHVDRQR